MGSIKENLEVIHKNINEACKRAGRDTSEVTLISVSKTKPVSDILEAIAAGERDFGENYVQELVAKTEEIKDDLTWHMIGPLQSNKVKKAVKAASIIHSVHSISIAETINKEAAKLGKIQDILIEINVGSELSKHGIDISEAEEVTLEIAKLDNLRIRGYMCIPPIAEDKDANRLYFRELKQLSDKMNKDHSDILHLDMLSMGMSSDYETAIEEGATHVRVGTAIFGARNYNK